MVNPMPRPAPTFAINDRITHKQQHAVNDFVLDLVKSRDSCNNNNNNNVAYPPSRDVIVTGGIGYFTRMAHPSGCVSSGYAPRSARGVWFKENVLYSY